ncbi:Suppressor of glycerol defect protein 1 [Cladophialophora carrionii]|uniref:Suppressor of glycerol defect protein 1 n=1 Tax=Cladophialophora carrionii TaxID=86049 RepID=A0A1C1CGF1_9EURO|nr:Suppressor of glycerol defect protein 1 [Cladophialophora carrionii]
MLRQSGGSRKGVKLPYALRQELGIEGHSREGGRRRQYGSVRGRKDQRRASRVEKRQHKPIRGSRPLATEEEFSEHDAGDDDDDEDDDEHEPPPESRPAKTTRLKTNAPKSVLEKSLKRSSPSPTPSDLPSIRSSRSSSPGLVLDANSRAFKDRAAQDEAEISALERKLGLNKNKTPKSSAEDGLDDLLEGLGNDERAVKRKSEGKEWLERKRRRTVVDEGRGVEHGASSNASEGDGEEAFDINEDDETDSLEDDYSEDDIDAHLDEGIEDEISDEEKEQDEAEAGSFDGFDLDEESAPSQPKKPRENPYVPPVTPSASTSKYIPPSLRKAQVSEGAVIERLKRQLQGHLNKLSEANLVSILGEIEKVYQSNPRQDVTTVLIELLLTLLCDRSALQNTFVILHAAFATAVYKVVGVDFGAELLSQLVARFDQYRDDNTGGKEALNLISLLSNLFTFHMIGSAIIFDYIRLLLGRLSENNTELLLRLIRDCGPQLRQDDPSSLKSIVQLMQKETARMNSAGEQMSVRTKFMIETITDLKNNKMKAATNNAGLSSEHITLMRKVLGSLNDKRNVRASEPLRVTRDDIKNSDKKGKWWLVGASWKGNEPAAVPEDITNTSILASGQDVDDESIDLLALSRQYGMNTDIRRSIFVALLSAVDYQDGHMRILKLRLKRYQEQEIPRVLLRCAAGEKPYNHYYTLVAKKLCLDKKMRKAFQFALWGFFRRLGETSDLDDEEEDQEAEDVDMTEIANLARLYAHLVLDGAIPLGVLKVLDLLSAKERTIMFVELMVAIILVEAEPIVLVKVLERTAADTPQLVKRLQFFIKKNVKTSDLLGRKDQKAVKQGCRVALETLSRLQTVEEEIEI